jgi:hypothetical protein
MTEIAGSGSISQRHGSADTDPYQTFMDPQHWGVPVTRVADPHSFDTDPDPAFWAEYRSRSNPDPGF